MAVGRFQRRARVRCSSRQRRLPRCASRRRRLLRRCRSTRLPRCPSAGPSLRRSPRRHAGSFALSTSTLGTVAGYNASVERPTRVGSQSDDRARRARRAPARARSGRALADDDGADVQLYRQAVASGGSNLPVRAGEILSERDLLLALLLPSADNIAESLAVWVSGNRTAFIARLNAKAAALGMAHTHYADPSGLSNKTVSTAADLVLLAKAVIDNPTLADLVVGAASDPCPTESSCTTSISCSSRNRTGSASRLAGPVQRAAACSLPPSGRTEARRLDASRCGARSSVSRRARHRSGASRARCSLCRGGERVATFFNSYSAVDLSQRSRR